MKTNKTMKGDAEDQTNTDKATTKEANKDRETYTNCKSPHKKINKSNNKVNKQ